MVFYSYVLVMKVCERYRTLENIKSLGSFIYNNGGCIRSFSNEGVLQPMKPFFDQNGLPQAYARYFHIQIDLGQQVNLKFKKLLQDHGDVFTFTCNSPESAANYSMTNSFALDHFSRAEEDQNWPPQATADALEHMEGQWKEFSRTRWSTFLRYYRMQIQGTDCTVQLLQQDLQKERNENTRLLEMISQEKSALKSIDENLLDKERQVWISISRVHDFLHNTCRFKVNLESRAWKFEMHVLEFLKKLIYTIYQVLFDVKRQLAELEQRVVKWTEYSKTRIYNIADCFGYIQREFLHILKPVEIVSKKQQIISYLLQEKTQ